MSGSKADQPRCDWRTPAGRIMSVTAAIKFREYHLTDKERLARWFFSTFAFSEDDMIRAIKRWPTPDAIRGRADTTTRGAPYEGEYIYSHPINKKLIPQARRICSNEIKYMSLEELVLDLSAAAAFKIPAVIPDKRSPTMSQYEVIYVSPDQLDPSPHQPKGRTTFDASMRRLQANIKDIGLQYPPLVLPTANGRFQIADGHRRFECMLNLHYPQIPVLPTQGKPDELYAGVSGNVAKMKASQWVEVYLSGGVVPGGQNKTCIKRLSDVMGNEYLQALAEKGWSPQIWNVSRRVLRYLSLSDDEQENVLNWLLSIGTREVTAWMQAGNSPDRLKAALGENRALSS